MLRYWLMTVTAGLLLLASGADAQHNYPSKPVRLIVPFAPGGAIDIVARLTAQKLSELFGVSVVVDNRAGAAGNVGTEITVRANPDGYTMLMVPASYAANAAIYKLPFDPVADVSPLALAGESGFMVTLHPSVPAKSVKELIAYDKANPGKLNYGGAGTGSGSHLASELFNQMAGTRITNVPYKGVGPALNDLLGGQIQIVFGGLAPMIPQIKANRLRGIAVTTAKRCNAVPDIPTVGETVAGYEAVNWFAAFGPKGLPKHIVVRWNSEINRILQLADVKDRMASVGVEPTVSSPERVHEVVRRDVAKWQKVVKIANIRPEH